MRELSQRALKQGELWGRAARDWATIQEPGFAPLWNAALDLAGVGAGTRVLDAGCGAGGACVLAAERRAEVFGADPSVNLITIARERLPHCDFRVAEMENLPFSNSGFDAVLAINSLQYTANCALAAYELGRVCRGAGRVVVGVPSDPQKCDLAHVFAAIVNLFETRPTSGGPFALSESRELGSILESRPGLRIDSIHEVECVHEYADLETALRGQMSAGGTWRAVEIVGEEPVREGIRAVLERFRGPGGKVRMRNWFRLALVLKA